MSNNLVSILYLVSAILFIFALRGLSHPESSRRGNIFGIAGMVIAIITTLMFKSVLSYTEIGAAILIGGLIGTFIALKIEMTALPQLVAAFHSLVGLAAVFVAAAAFYDPVSFNIGEKGIKQSNRNEYRDICWSYNFFWIYTCIWQASRNDIWSTYSF